MWMSRTLENERFNHSNNNNQFQHSNSYSQNNQSTSSSSSAGDWKSKLVENGQRLGGKVLEYGIQFAKRNSSSSSHQNLDHQQPKNDGRANWMADIRNSSNPYSMSENSGGYSGGGGGGYQNDFATTRPMSYSDCGYNNNNNSNKDNSNGYMYHSQAPGYSDNHSTMNSSSRKVKKSRSKKEDKKRNKKTTKKHRHKKKPEVSSDDSEEDEGIVSTDSVEEERVKAVTKKHKGKRTQSKKHSKKKTKKKQSFYSESESDDDSSVSESSSSEVSSSSNEQVVEKESSRKASSTANSSSAYKYSFDPSLLPAPTAKHSKNSTSKKEKKKSKTKKKTKIIETDESSDQSSCSEASPPEQKHKKKKNKKVSHKSKIEPEPVVDLFDFDSFPAPEYTSNSVDTGCTPNANETISSTPATSTGNAFDHMAPIDQLAGLHFEKQIEKPSLMEDNHDIERVSYNAKDNLLLPGGENLVDLSCLGSSEIKSNKKPTGSGKSLNEMQQQAQSQKPHSTMYNLQQPAQYYPQQQQQQQQMMAETNGFSSNAMFPSQSQGYTQI